jgi:hypothetical protein
MISGPPDARGRDHPLFRRIARCRRRALLSASKPPQADLRALYDELQVRHALPLASRQLRVAVDGEFAKWKTFRATGRRSPSFPR